MNLTASTQKLLGRYEYTHSGSYKYWQVKFLKDDNFEVSWGRIGYGAQGTNRVNTQELTKKAKEKLQKGYAKVAFPEIDNYHEKLMLDTELKGLVPQLDITSIDAKKKFKI